MTQTFSGVYENGRSASPHDVRVTLAPAGLRIEGIGGDQSQLWPYGDVRLIDEIASGQTVKLASIRATGAQLSIASPVFGSEIKARMASHVATRRASRPGLRLIALIAIGAAVAVLAIGLLVPRTAGWLADLIPLTWEEIIGARLAEAITDAAHATSDHTKRPCDTPAGKTALERLTNRLSEAADSPYTFSVRIVPQKTVNALAVPGGHIVIFSGLIEFGESPDEVAGVLAHEMAHITHRHVTTAVLRGVGYAAIFDLLSGGVAGGVIGLGHELLTLAYSRDAEAEADATGLEILERAGIGAHGFVAFWDRMRNREGKGSAVKPPALLSTHPDSDERATLARSARQTGTPALTAEEWLALRAICAG